MTAVHVARLGLFTVDANGNRIDKCCAQTSINDLKNTSLAFLVLPDTNIPNSVGYPTIERYLQLEGQEGYNFRHLDQSFVITDDIPGIEAAKPGFLMNEFTGAAVAYSLRKLREGYTGACIRVRRSSDSTEQDIGFVAGFVDTASLLTFCGAGDGFVVTWYDQTANGRNKTMATTTKQPKIVTAGALELENGKACIVTDGSDDELVSADYIASNLTDMTLFSVVRFSSTVGICPIYGKYLTTGDQRSFFLGVRDGNWWAQFSSNGTSVLFSRVDSTSNPPSAQNLSVIRIAANESTADKAAFRRNGVTTAKTEIISGADSVFDATAPIGIASNGSGGDFAGLRLQELVLWLDNQAINTPGIEENINRFWSVY